MITKDMGLLAFFALEDKRGSILGNYELYRKVNKG